MANFQGSGISAPLRISAGDVVASEESLQIKESIMTILGTKIGERTMQPTFGSKLHYLMFEDMDDPANQALAQTYTIDAVRTWEPRVVPIDVGVYRIVQGDREGYALLLNYLELATNTPDNVVYPFYQNTVEG